MASETIATSMGFRDGMIGQHRHSSTSSWSYSACSSLVEQSITHRNVSQEYFFLSVKMFMKQLIGVLRSTPVAQLAPRNLLTRWDVSSIPANAIFLTKN